MILLVKNDYTDQNEFCVLIKFFCRRRVHTKNETCLIFLYVRCNLVTNLYNYSVK